MTRWLICTLITMALATSAHAQEKENPFTKMWPFGKPKQTTPEFGANPFKQVSKKSEGSSFSMLSPSKMFDKAGKGTDAMFKKTKSTFKGVSDFGKSLNPFAGKSKPSKPKKSLLDTIMPKQPVSSAPATMNDFMKMPRPKY